MGILPAMHEKQGLSQPLSHVTPEHAGYWRAGRPPADALVCGDEDVGPPAAWQRPLRACGAQQRRNVRLLRVQPQALRQRVLVLGRLPWLH